MLPRQPTLPPIEKPAILIVEGVEDQFFFDAIIKVQNLKNIQTLPIGGKTQLKRNLEALKDNANFSKVRSIGIVRDADDNPGGAFQSVCGALKAVNFPVPKQPLQMMIQELNVGVLILPDSQTAGSLEDICIHAVQTEPAMACVDQYFDCLQKQGLAIPQNFSKARLQVFLASIEAELRLGEAASKGFLPWDSPVFDPLKSFLQQLVSA